MKKLYPAVAALCCFVFISCEKDVSEENGSLPLPAKTIAANDNALVNNYCKDCNYIPQCSGAVYKYSDTAAGGSATTTTQTMTFEKDTVVNNATYRKFNVTGGNASYMNCQANSTTILSINGSSASGTSVPVLKLTMLKANAVAGSTWNDQNTISGILTAYRSTLVAKNFSKTVSGTIYPDVMHVRQITSAVYPGLGPTDIAQTDYFYAKGIGLIETVTADLLSGAQTMHRVLISATIP